MTARTIAWYAVGVALFAIAPLVPGIVQTDDHGTEWAESESLAELQATEAGTARREAAGQALCNEARGPNSQARWTADGDLVCRSGNRFVATFFQGAPK